MPATRDGQRQLPEKARPTPERRHAQTVTSCYGSAQIWYAIFAPKDASLTNIQFLPAKRPITMQPQTAPDQTSTGITVNGETRLFPVLGDPVDQVRSPEVVSRILAERGSNAIVVPMHVKPADLASVFSAFLRICNLGGMLITVPHKQASRDLCADCSDRARFVSSVNVVRRTANGWYGDNTDGIGFLDAIAAKGFDVTRKRVLLAGLGGAGAAIALEFLLRGVGLLALHDIDTIRRDSLCDRLEARFPGRVATGGADPRGFDLLANATPLGMRPDDPYPFDVEGFRSGQFVACVVTKPEISPLILEARRRGCDTVTGIDMFDAQAARLAGFLERRNLDERERQIMRL
ncbi:shikimate dehydrogenase family protein [Rhizobium straminoryzae]|nr:shikimate dehydrogenase [Rhizobium straminoryzae]